MTLLTDGLSQGSQFSTHANFSIKKQATYIKPALNKVQWSKEGGQRKQTGQGTFSEAVASLVPLVSNASAAKGLSWAGIMLAAR